MKTAKKIFVTVLVLLIAGPAAMAQNKSSIAKKADDLFATKQYVAALSEYESAYNRIKSNKVEKNRIYCQMGECYRRINNFPKARRIFTRLISQGYYKTEPKIYFYMAEMCRFEMELDQANEYYDLYLELVPNDELAISRKEHISDSRGFVTQLLMNRTRHVLRRLDNWNTDYDDWSPHFLGDDTNTLVFTSSRPTEGSEIDPSTGQYYSDIFYVFQDRRGQWTTNPELFDASGKINTAINEGEGAFSADGKSLYYSRCDVDVKRNKAMGCYVYYTFKKSTAVEGRRGAKKNAEDAAPAEWEEPVRLDLGDTIYNYMYPELSRDELTLYFSSDMPGGQGDYDLWMVTRRSKDEPWGKPINLGPTINTPGREGYPVLHADTALFFSSNGLPGLGGYDLFRSVRLGPRRWSTPENLGVPINSSYDETGMILYPGDHPVMLERGYFSSNRPFDDPHNRNIDNKGKMVAPINDNLYYFELPPLLYTLEGTIRDEKSMQLMENVKVRIVGSDGRQYETYTDKKGFYRFENDKIRRNVIYKIYLSKVDYFSLEGSESTRGYTTNKDIVHDFRMEPVPKQPVVLPEIRYDLAKWDLKEEFMDSLMDLYLVMVNNPNVVVELRAHTDCRPFIGVTNDTLSQRRAQSVVDYLVSRGIEPERLVAKGYGERVPRVIDHNLSIVVGGKPYSFAKGTVLNCDYVNMLPSPEYQEAAHQLNRRMEFLVLRTDYVPKRLVDNMASETALIRYDENGKVVDLVNKPVETDASTTPIIVHDESSVPVTMIQSAKGELECIVNGSLMPMLVDERFAEPIAMSWEEAMSFLYQRRINKEDFPDRDNAFDPEGNILDKATVIFKEMQIGQKKIRNVEVVVVKNVDYKFIINRTGLLQFGEYEFDKQRGKLYFID
ncbi:MAG: PD40 domain-containing protein [Bacteroidales bacterium]|nr:PD40 domain-containing protein [Bacteroidales bacterium]